MCRHVHNINLLPALPDLQRLGMPVPDHTHRRNPGNRTGESKAVLEGIPGSETEGGAGMSALPLDVHR